MDKKRPSVREWQEAYRAGEFDGKDVSTQTRAGWYDWWCADSALAGRLRKIAPVVMGVTEPVVLDNYYVWFKNNCPAEGPLYDDVRFEPLDSERDGRYFLVSLDSPHETQKWIMYSERHDSTLQEPEFGCGHVHEMCRHINDAARELAAGLPESSKESVRKQPDQRSGRKASRKRSEAR